MVYKKIFYTSLPRGVPQPTFGILEITEKGVYGSIMEYINSQTFLRKFWFIKQASIFIKYGEKILLTGNSGSGKSTLLRIIVKYLDNYKGLLFID